MKKIVLFLLLMITSCSLPNTAQTGNSGDNSVNINIFIDKELIKSLTLPRTDASQAPVNIDLNSSSNEGSKSDETASPKPSATPTLLQDTNK